MLKAPSFRCRTRCCCLCISIPVHLGVCLCVCVLFLPCAVSKLPGVLQACPLPHPLPYGMVYIGAIWVFLHPTGPRSTVLMPCYHHTSSDAHKAAKIYIAAYILVNPKTAATDAFHHGCVHCNVPQRHLLHHPHDCRHHYHHQAGHCA
jgi:hypothetical protein